jgi:predicted nucleic acid-binding protein
VGLFAGGGEFCDLPTSTANVQSSDELKTLASEIVNNGLKPEDATHVASAIFAKCDYLFTTDDRILKYKDDRIRIMNPTDFIIEGAGDTNE